MTVSRKSVGSEGMDMDQVTADDSLADKRESQARSGYDPIPDSELVHCAVDEKLPMGSQSY